MPSVVHKPPTREIAIASLPARARVVLAWSQSAWFAAVVSLWTAIVFTLPMDPDYTAGEMLDHLLGWMETGLLYPALGQGPTLRVLNYPPLVPVLTRGLVELGLTSLLAGRLMNTVGLLVLVGAVCAWARARGSRGSELAGTVGLLAASYGVVYGAGQMHIELWAVALTVGGFWLLASGAGRREAILGGLLLALACFAKQSQVVPALVAVAWAWRHRRPAARPATAVFVIAGVLGCAAITIAWGLEPWRHMLTYTTGTYSLGNLGLQLLSHVAPWILLIGWVGIALARQRAVAATDALAWYWVASALWSLAAARIGSGYPYFLDLQVATVLWVGPRLFGTPLRRSWSWLLGLQVAGANLGAAGAAAFTLVAKRTAAAELPDICSRFPSGGPVLTEEAGLARACGRNTLMHPFIMTSLATRGLWETASIEAAVRAGAYSPIILPFDPRAPGRIERERWTAGMLAAFRSAPQISSVPGGLWEARW